MYNEKLLKELKEYNKDLEKHLPQTDFSSFNDFNLFEKSNPIEEMIYLLVDNMNDLKSEMSLMRRNLSNEIENMIKTNINNQQEEIINNIFKQNNQFTSNIKENMENFKIDISSDIFKLKKEVSKAQNSINNLTENSGQYNQQSVLNNQELQDIKNNIKSLKEKLNNIEEQVQKNQTIEIGNKKMIEKSNKNKPTIIHSNQPLKERSVSIEKRIKKLESLKTSNF